MTQSYQIVYRRIINIYTQIVLTLFMYQQLNRGEDVDISEYSWQI